VFLLSKSSSKLKIIYRVPKIRYDLLLILFFNFTFFKISFINYHIPYPIINKRKANFGTISSLFKFLSLQDSVVVGSLSQDSTTGANSESG